VDLFVSQGVVVISKDAALKISNGLHDVVNSRNRCRSGQGGTASAAEIVAGALQDYGRAIIVEKKLMERGVQNIYETQSSLGIHYRGRLEAYDLWYYLLRTGAFMSLHRIFD